MADREAGTPSGQDNWLRPRAVRLLWVVFAIALALTIVPDFFIEHYDKFGVDGTFGFAAWFGFASCVGLVAVAFLLGRLLKRRDTYYDD